MSARLACLATLLLVACSPPPPRNLVLISVDTLRADHLGAYGSERDLSPNLDALAAESIVFEHAWAPAPYTLPSLAALMTGRHPETLGIRTNVTRIPNGVRTLADRLHERGFRTIAVVGNAVASKRTGLAAGFDVFDTTSHRSADHDLAFESPLRITDAALREAEALVAGGDERVFLWVHYLDPHGPYTPTDEARERELEAERSRPDGRRALPFLPQSKGFGGIPRYQRVEDQREVAFYRAGYAAEVRGVDREIGRLLAGLEARALLDSTVVLFTADHGESLGEGDAWFLHGENLNEPSVRVPLVLRLPDGEGAGSVRSEPASLLDVVPTLLARFGLLPDAGTEGVDLLGPPRARNLLLANSSAVATDRSVALVDGSQKLIRKYVDGTAVDALYLLPDETRNVASESPERAEALGQALDAKLRGE